MTETAGGARPPQTQPPQQPYLPPQPARHPYAGPEWPSPEAASPRAVHGPYGSAGAAAAYGSAGEPGPAGPGGPAEPGGPAGGGPGGADASAAAGPLPAGAPQPALRAGGARRLVAVAALTAVLGGLVGGGAVAAFDSGGASTVAAGGVTRDGGTAPTAATQAGTVEAAAAAATRSVVTLTVRGSSGSGTGSGVVVRADGYILTNEHVVADGASGGSITVTFDDGREASAEVVGTDPITDLAVVKVSGVTGLTAATFADSDTVKVGQSVLAIGSPLGLDGTVTEGIVSALARPTRAGSDDTAVIDAVQTDAPINPGNSGGPLVDLAGRVVGINTSIATAGSGGGLPGQSGSSGNIGIGFAIPADTAASVAEQLIADGSASHAYLGVQTGGSTAGGSTAGGSTGAGATLVSVEPGGPAAEAGLRSGDVVTEVDDRTIADSNELVAAVRSYGIGDRVELTVRREGAERTVTVTLGSDDKQ